MSVESSKIINSISNEFPLLGVALRHHRTTRGKPLTFKDKPYLIELYKDFPKIDGADGMKAVQVGWSELLVQLVLERAGFSGRVTAYILPTFQLRDRFVQQRVDPLLSFVPAYKEKLMEGNLGSLRAKRFGKGNMMFLGSNTPNDFIEFSADVLIVDEYDRCDPNNITMARDRLRASPYPQMFRVGNPTISNFGISRLYAESDGRKWFFMCDHCKSRQNIDWFENIVTRTDSGEWVLRDARPENYGRVRPVCRKCKEPFERTPDNAAWVASRPSVPRRGYQMSRLDIISQDIEPLFLEFKEAQGVSARIKSFYASVLGIPYEESGASISSEAISKCCIGEPIDYGGGEMYKKKYICAGIDVGNVLNINISELVSEDDGTYRRVCIYIGAYRSFAELYNAICRYHVRVVVIDSRPETRKAQELQAKCMEHGKAQVWLAQFHPTDRIGRQQYGVKKNHYSGTVTVDRTQLLDACLDEIRSNPPTRVFPEDATDIPDWIEQMKAPKRMLNAKGTRYIWSEGNKADHYRLCDAYDKIACDIMMQGAEYIVI